MPLVKECAGVKVVVRNSVSCAGGLAQADRLASAAASTAVRSQGRAVRESCIKDLCMAKVAYVTRRAPVGAPVYASPHAATLGRHHHQVGEVVLPASPCVLQVRVHAGAFLRQIKLVG